MELFLAKISERHFVLPQLKNHSRAYVFNQQSAHPFHI